MNSEVRHTDALKAESSNDQPPTLRVSDPQEDSAQSNRKLNASPVLEGPAPAQPVRRVPPPPPYPREINGGHELWRNASKLARNTEGETISMNASLDTTLIFAGLFSAVNSTLLAISLSSLSPGSNDETNELLRLLIPNNAALPPRTPFKPTSSAVLDNLLFSTSLLFSLFAAFGAVLAKQWLVYNTIFPFLGEMREADQRIERMKCAERWRLRLLLELFLPALLQISLSIFILGMVHFFWGINAPVGIWCCILAVGALAAFCTTVVLAIKYPECPFQSPLSMIVWPKIRPYVKKLPAWVDVYFPEEPFERPAVFRGWPTIKVRSIEQLIGFPVPKFLTGDAKLLSSTISFTLQRADQLKDALPAVLGIPTITDFDSCLRLSFSVGGQMLQFLKEAIVQLDREASSGYSADSLASVTILTRAFLHFYVANIGIWQVDWPHWFADTNYQLSNLALPDTELAYLKLVAGNDSDFLVSTALPTPPMVYVFASVMRFQKSDIAIHRDDSVLRPLAQAFTKMAIIALPQDVDWDTLSVSVAGLLLISKSSKTIATWLSENGYPNGAVPPNTLKASARKPDDGAEEIWELYTRSLRRCVALISRGTGRPIYVLTRSIGFDSGAIDWVSVMDLFDSYSEELDLYIGNHSIWNLLVQKLSKLHVYPQHSIQLVSAFGAFWRRLDARRRAVDPLSPWNSGLQTTLDNVQHEFKTAFQNWDKTTQSLNQKMDALASSASEFLRQTPDSNNSSFIVYLTMVEMEVETPLQYESFLEGHPQVMDAMCLALTSQDMSIAAGAFWALLRHPPKWLDREASKIRSAFIEANLARSLIGMAARSWAQSPCRNIARVFDETLPLIGPLLERPVWIPLVIAAIADSNILAFLALGPSKTPWDMGDAGTLSRVIRKISHANVRMILLQWNKIRTLDRGQSEVSRSVVSVWFGADVVGVLVELLLRRDTREEDDTLDNLIISYIDGLQAFGDGETHGLEGLQDAMTQWQTRLQSFRNPKPSLGYSWNYEVLRPLDYWI